jgi:cytidine deaminase
MAPNDEGQSALISVAIAARDSAYAPYSNYAVGAAIRTSSGSVYTGANVENAVNSLGTCAERVAVFKAVSAGEMDFVEIAVVTENGGSPCGSCRQVLAEFGLDTKVVVADPTGKIHLRTTVDQLLPESFGPLDLK